MDPTWQQAVVQDTCGYAIVLCVFSKFTMSTRETGACHETHIDFAVSNLHLIIFLAGDYVFHQDITTFPFPNMQGLQKNSLVFICPLRSPDIHPINYALNKLQTSLNYFKPRPANTTHLWTDLKYFYNDFGIIPSMLSRIREELSIYLGFYLTSLYGKQKCNSFIISYMDPCTTFYPINCFWWRTLVKPYYRSCLGHLYCSVSSEINHCQPVEGAQCYLTHS